MACALPLGLSEVIAGKIEVQPHPIDWVTDPDEDDDDTAPGGVFNDPSCFEPGDEEEDDAEEA